MYIVLVLLSSVYWCALYHGALGSYHALHHMLLLMCYWRSLFVFSCILFCVVLCYVCVLSYLFATWPSYAYCSWFCFGFVYLFDIYHELLFLNSCHGIGEKNVFFTFCFPLFVVLLAVLRCTIICITYISDFLFFHLLCGGMYVYCVPHGIWIFSRV